MSDSERTAAQQSNGAGESPPQAQSPEQAEEKPAQAAEDAQRAEEPGQDQGSERAAETVAEDLDELAQAKRERDSYLELAQRTKADFDNYRKRVAKEAADAVARGRAELARELIPVADNLERAVESVESAADEGLSKGVSLVLDELREVLKRAGVEAYDPVGEKFDPTWHEALSTKPAAEGTEPGTVVETLERGYRINGQVLRAARVVVSE